MLKFYKMTAEEVLIESFKTDPKNIATIMGAADDTKINLTWSVPYSLPAKYAKAILKDYINENCGN